MVRDASCRFDVVGRNARGSVSDGFLRSPGIGKKKSTAFSNSKGGGFKALDASDQSIADLLKKNTVLNDFITEISLLREKHAVPMRKSYPCSTGLSTIGIVFPLYFQFSRCICRFRLTYISTDDIFFYRQYPIFAGTGGLKNGRELCSGN